MRLDKPGQKNAAGSVKDFVCIFGGFCRVGRTESGYATSLDDDVTTKNAILRVESDDRCALNDYSFFHIVQNRQRLYFISM